MSHTNAFHPQIASELPSIADSIAIDSEPSEPDHTVQPDIQTASVGYVTRFSGKLGEYFLNVQAEAVFALTANDPEKPLKILEVGGGHGQLTSRFLARNHEVWVHGSAPECFTRLQELKNQYPEKLHFVRSPLEKLPFGDQTFDLVVAVRLLGHVTDIRGMLREMCRVSTKQVLFDFASSRSFNCIAPLFFPLKKRIERNTRQFFYYSLPTIAQHLEAVGYQVQGIRKQYFLPMAVHRLLNKPRATELMELFFKKTGLTRAYGSPVILLAESISRDLPL